MWCEGDVRVMWCDVIWCDVMWWKDDVMCCDGTSIHAMSMVSHEISWWDISVVQVIQVFLLIQVMQVRLAHLWPDFRVILYA